MVPQGTGPCQIQGSRGIVFKRLKLGEISTVFETALHIMISGHLQDKVSPLDSCLDTRELPHKLLHWVNNGLLAEHREVVRCVAKLVHCRAVLLSQPPQLRVLLAHCRITQI